MWTCVPQVSLIKKEQIEEKMTHALSTVCASRSGSEVRLGPAGIQAKESVMIPYFIRINWVTRCAAGLQPEAIKEGIVE